MLKKYARVSVALAAGCLLSLASVGCSGGSEDSGTQAYSMRAQEVDADKFLEGQGEIVVTVPQFGSASFYCEHKTGDGAGSGTVTLVAPGMRLVYGVDFEINEDTDGSCLLKVTFMTFHAGRSSYSTGNKSYAVKRYLHIAAPERLLPGSPNFGMVSTLRLRDGAATCADAILTSAKEWDDDSESTLKYATFYDISETSSYIDFDDEDFEITSYTADNWTEDCMAGSFTFLQSI